MEKGKLIVLDGLDGCGKSTQFEQLRQVLCREGKIVKSISFPMYDKSSAALVKMYLRGDFSQTPDGVNAYAASSFYAVDRYANYKLDWEQNYNRGEWILASRYTTSNAIHQMSKLPQEAWDEYLAWLEDYEYQKLGLPKPDLVLFLSVPLAVSQKMLSKRYQGDISQKDIHEADLHYLEQCSLAADYAGKKMGWQMVECSDGTALYSIEQICGDLYRRIREAFSC